MWVPEYRAVGLSQELRKYEELEFEVKQLCGYNFECLRELFAMGYTLQPPNRELTMNQITKLMIINNGYEL